MIDLIHKIDWCILIFIKNNLHNYILDIIMPFVTSLGNCGAVWLIITAFLIIRKDTRNFGIKMLVVLILCGIIGNIILKPLFARTRPFSFIDFDTLIKEPLDFSFPSGHTMASFACAYVIYAMNRKAGYFFFALASIIAFSRLYLFVHFPSDVFAGMVIGILISKVAIKLMTHN